ncbi:MAG: 3-beta hydroxysteroid dehydrogenase [Planctomycetaceae bacterium]|nr:3-beta hydroxysteroid dehydrogenase [Planctomycetaceae bacterium]
MHALVTGGGGFLATYLCEMLIADGAQVRSFSRGEYPELEKLGVEVQQGDLCDRHAVTRACENIDCVFHTAALPGIGGPWQLFRDTNYLGTQNVLAGCRTHHIARLVYTSSPSTTFAGVDQCGIDESAPFDLAWLEQHDCHYSRSKALAELEVLKANNQGNLRTCALRPHLIWGPRDGQLIPRLIARAKLGRLRRVGDGTNLVDMTYVENAAEAHLLAANALANKNSPVAGNAYFISQGEPVNCWQWIDDILALANVPAVKKSISRQSAWRLGAALEWIYGLFRIRQEPPMTRFLSAQLATSHWFDVSAATRDFGYVPRISTAEGMQRLDQWLRQDA